MQHYHGSGPLVNQVYHTLASSFLLRELKFTSFYVNKLLGGSKAGKGRYLLSWTRLSTRKNKRKYETSWKESHVARTKMNSLQILKM